MIISVGKDVKKLEPLYSRGPQPPGTSTGPWPVRNQAAQQEVSSGQAKLHLLLPITPHRLHYRLNHSPSPPICGKIVFYKTGPWCQKRWGPLSYTADRYVKWCYYFGKQSGNFSNGYT